MSNLSKDLRGIHSDEYNAPQLGCCKASVSVAIDRDTGALITKPAAGGASGSSGTFTANSTTPFTGEAYAFVVVEDTVLSALTASGEETPANLVGPTLPAGLVIVTDVEAATVTSGTITFYLK